MSHEKPKMNEIEAALAAWTPRAPQLDRDRLMYEAGRASPSPAILAGNLRPLTSPYRPTRHLWPLATCLSTAAAVVMAFLLAQQEPVDRQDRVARGQAAEKVELPPQVAVTLTSLEVTEAPPLWGGMGLPSAPEGTYLALRNRMLTTPVDEWPRPRSLNDDVRRGAAAVEDDARSAAVEDDAARKPPTSRNLLREFLPPETEPVRRYPLNTPAAQTADPQEALT